MTRVRQLSLSPLSLGALLATLLAMLLLVPLGTASAHDQLTGTEPADGATLEQAPEELVLTFSGEIAQVGAQVLVTGPDGEPVGDGEPRVAGTELTQALAADLPAGAYQVTWRVTSQDGHPISGTFGFEATAGAGGEEPTTEAATSEETSTPETSAPAPTAEETTPAATTEQATDDADPSDGPEADGSTGLPVWAWVLVGLGVVGLLGLLARTWARGRE